VVGQDRVHGPQSYGQLVAALLDLLLVRCLPEQAGRRPVALGVPVLDRLTGLPQLRRRVVHLLQAEQGLVDARQHLGRVLGGHQPAGVLDVAEQLIPVVRGSQGEPQPVRDEDGVDPGPGVPHHLDLPQVVRPVGEGGQLDR
jgi:hypothetical protein